MNYKAIILAGSFQLTDGSLIVNSELVNEVAKLWAIYERGIDAMMGTDAGLDVPPL